jgi:Rod binding domain-containing protein
LSAVAQNATDAVSQNGNLAPSTSSFNSPAYRKLRSAAAEFEGMLLSSLWKSMKSTFASPDDDSADPAHDTLDDLGIQTMSNAVAKAGGLGLGKLILKHLEPMVDRPRAELGPQSGKASAVSADNNL